MNHLLIINSLIVLFIAVFYFSIYSSLFCIPFIFRFTTISSIIFHYVLGLPRLAYLWCQGSVLLHCLNWMSFLDFFNACLYPVMSKLLFSFSSTMDSQGFTGGLQNSTGEWPQTDKLSEDGKMLWNLCLEFQIR